MVLKQCVVGEQTPGFKIHLQRRHARHADTHESETGVGRQLEAQAAFQQIRRHQGQEDMVKSQDTCT